MGATCTSFSAPATTFDSTAGAQLADGYPYNEPHPAHSICINPAITHGKDCVPCQFHSDQSACPVYRPEQWTDVRVVSVSELVMAVQQRRSGEGIVDHRIVERSDDAQRVLHVVSTRHHQRDFQPMIEQLFELEVAARAASYEQPPQPVALPVPQTRSYLALVLS